MHCKQTLLLLIALSFTGQVLAEGNGQDLLAIYQLATQHDPAWAAARSAHGATQEKLVQGKALTLPSVSLNANATHSNTDLEYRSAPHSAFNQGGGKESFENYGYSLNVSHPLYRKQNTIQYEESKTLVTQAEDQLNAAKLDLMTRTSQAYFNVLLAQDKIDLIVAQKAAITRQLEQAKANFDVGTATITDVHEAQARFDLLVAQEIAANNDLALQNHAIESITGELPQPLRKAKEVLPVRIPEPQSMEKWVEIAEQQNPQLKIQQLALTLAGQEVDRNHAGHFPTLDAVGSYADSRANGGSTGVGNDVQSFTIGLQFQLPLYQGGAITSRERESIANQQTARDTLEETRRQIHLKTRQAYLSVANAVAQVKAYEQALTSSKSAMESTSLGYEVGVRTSVDVLNAQQQLYSAKRDLLQARYNWLLSVIQLKAAAGILTDNDLAETNRLLESNDT